MHIDNGFLTRVNPNFNFVANVTQANVTQACVRYLPHRYPLGPRRPRVNALRST